MGIIPARRSWVCLVVLACFPPISEIDTDRIALTCFMGHTLRPYRVAIGALNACFSGLAMLVCSQLFHPVPPKKRLGGTMVEQDGTR